tara:strand:- start:382 stop:1407 length:1026 start_codon:yes stop_codon:yes gene_type:complete
MTGVIKVDDIQDAGANSIVSSNGSGTLTFGSFSAPNITASTAILPDASDGAAIGSASLEWSDIFLADGAVINLGDDQDVTLTHVADTGIQLNSTMKLMFNDASQFIQGSSATVLSIGATDEIDLTATAVDLNGTLNVSGVATFQATPVFPDGSLALADLDIDGGTDIGAAIVDADLFIIDDGAGGTNRKTAASRIKTYIGTNSPNFYAHQSGGAQQTISNATGTVLVFDQEVYDTGSDYDTSNGRFTPGESGKYFFHSMVRLDTGDVDADAFSLQIKKNGSTALFFNQFHSDYTSVAVSGTLEANGSGDYFEVEISQNTGSSKAVTTNQNYTFFQGHKLIE